MAAIFHFDELAHQIQAVNNEIIIKDTMSTTLSTINPSATCNSRSSRENNSSRLVRPFKKKMTFKSLKHFLVKFASSSKSKRSSCTWTELGDSFGTIDFCDEKNEEEEGYGNYEDYGSYSVLDFLQDELSSPPRIGIISCHLEESLCLRDTRNPEDIEVEIVEDMVNATEQKIFIHEMSVILDTKSLIKKARSYYHSELYEDALLLQLEALDLIQSTICGYECIDLQLRMLEAKVEYEILKVKYALLKESFTTDERKLAHNKAQNAKWNLLNKAVTYYQDELLHLNGRDKIDISNLDKVGYTLYLLHTLGNIHRKNLAQYSQALAYYNEALCLEIEVSTFLEANHEGMRGDYAREIKSWNMNIRATKKKIGMIHYINGRFGLALKSSFAP